MPFVVKALLDNRKRYEREAAEIGADTLFEREPRARGYLRPREGYRLYDMRDQLCTRLRADVAANRDWLMSTLKY
jgi:deoxyhypusine synthase